MFTEHADALVERLRSGGKWAKHFDASAERTQARSTSGVKGKANLRDAYVAEVGDLVTNGKKRAVVDKYQWKDSALRTLLLLISAIRAHPCPRCSSSPPPPPPLPPALSRCAALR